MTQEQHNQLIEFATWIKGRTNEHHPKEIIDKLFYYHSLIYPKHPSYKKNCITCRKTIYNELMKYLDNQQEITPTEYKKNCCKG